MTIIRDELEKLQFKIKDLTDLAARNQASNNKGAPKIQDLSNLDKEFSEKCEKIKVRNIKLLKIRMLLKHFIKNLVIK